MKHKSYADLDEIVFEGREKEYGAYQMRRRYNRILVRSSLIVFLLFLCVTGMPKILKWFAPTSAVVPMKSQETVIPDIMLDLPIEKEDPIEEPPPPVEFKKPEPKPKVKTIEFKVIEPAPEDQVEDTASVLDMQKLLEEKTAAISFKNQDGDDYDGSQDLDALDDLIGKGDGGPLEVQPLDTMPDPNVYFPGEPPKPINMEQLKNLIGYPELAKQAGVEGKVTLRVLVDKRGRYKKHLVLRSPSNLLLRPVEKQLPKLIFTPGIQNQRPVPVWVNIPFDFVLNRR